MPTRVVITGCCGRMGKSIALLASADKDINITGAVEARSHPDIGKDLGNILGKGPFDVFISGSLEDAVESADVIIDFTTPTSTISNLSIARNKKLPIVIGTTGLTDEEHKVIESVSRSIPVLFSANMSVGVNTLFRVAADMANALGDDYDVEIIESHHNKKKDAPSGTAKRLAEVIAQAKGKAIKDIAIFGREGNVGQRPKGQIGIHSVRGGDIVGDHTVVYAGDNERIEIVHRAHSRDVFANGALRAAKYLAERSPGLYNMQDVLEGV
jgi:4-hydroxy-tetrahydrodipicolinate reductase